MAKGSGTPSSSKSSTGKPRARPAPAPATAAHPVGPDLPRLVALAGLPVAVWASLPRFSGPKLNVAQSTEVVDHVIPAVVVLLAALAAIAAGRRARGPGSTRFLAGMAVLLAGLWMMATHVPLLAQARRGDAPWPATMYHTSAALAVFGLGLLWATVTWSEASDEPKAASQAQK